VVVIIYQEELNKEASEVGFSPALISSNYNHVFVVVRRLCDTRDKILYRVGVTSRKGVIEFRPRLYTETFEHGPEFRDWLLLKCINGEQASYQSERFKDSRQRAHQAQLIKILNHHRTYSPL